MRRLLSGQFDRALYVDLMRNLAVIYRTLEPLLARHAMHPWIAAIHDPALFRAEAIAADLRDLDAAAARPAAAATLAYAERLQALDRDAPQLLAAHAYVRYLGDLSGGQALRRIVGGALGLAPPKGLRFYDFGEAATVVARAHAFRQGLACIRADASAAQALVAEARQAFQLHAALFRELDPDPPEESEPELPRA
jgi:heme oxygenase (biliverdin-producing, ferredoxin)